MALYSSVVVMKGFNSSTKLLKAEIVTVKLKAGLLLNVSLHIHPLTFINEALCLSDSPVIKILVRRKTVWVDHI